MIGVSLGCLRLLVCAVVFSMLSSVCVDVHGAGTEQFALWATKQKELAGSVVISNDMNQLTIELSFGSQEGNSSTSWELIEAHVEIVCDPENFPVDDKAASGSPMGRCNPMVGKFKHSSDYFENSNGWVLEVPISELPEKCHSAGDRVYIAIHAELYNPSDGRFETAWGGNFPLDTMQPRFIELCGFTKGNWGTFFSYKLQSHSNQGEICNAGNDTVALLVHPLIADDIRDNLNQFELDLCGEGYAVIERLSDFSSPQELRTYLRDKYIQTGKSLVGSIFIGDFPKAYQFVTTSYAEEELISLQYFNDLDGEYKTSANYISPGGHEYSFDLHEGEIDWEIWVGLLPIYKGDLNLTTDAINRYFEKNHSYRMGEYSIPNAFLQINEHHSATTIEEHNFFLGLFTDGSYSWTPFSNSGNVLFYFNSPPANLSVEQGYASLSAGVADFTVGDAHGYWGAHGQININWVESNPVKTVIFFSNGCAVGNIDYPDNFLTSILYSPTSMVLTARGSTNNSGGMGTGENGFFGHNIATALSQGKSFGESILSHVNVPLVEPWSNSRELHFAPNIILGDPTLGKER